MIKVVIVAKLLRALLSLTPRPRQTAARLPESQTFETARQVVA